VTVAGVLREHDVHRLFGPEAGLLVVMGDVAADVDVVGRGLERELPALIWTPSPLFLVISLSTIHKLLDL